MVQIQRKKVKSERSQRWDRGGGSRARVWLPEASVSWASDSWFWLRSWSHSWDTEPRIGLHAEHRACLRFSFSLSLCPSPHTRALPLPPSLSLSQKKAGNDKMFNLISYYENRIKTMMRYSHKIIRMAFPNPDNIKSWQGYKNSIAILQHSVAAFIKLDTHLPRDPS